MLVVYSIDTEMDMFVIFCSWFWNSVQKIYNQMSSLWDEWNIDSISVFDLKNGRINIPNLYNKCFVITTSVCDMYFILTIDFWGQKNHFFDKAQMESWILFKMHDNWKEWFLVFHQCYKSFTNTTFHQNPPVLQM